MAVSQSSSSLKNRSLETSLRYPLIKQLTLNFENRITLIEDCGVEADVKWLLNGD